MTIKLGAKVSKNKSRNMKKVALIKAVIETESIQIAERERGFIKVNLSKMELTHNVDIAIKLMVV